MEQEGQVIVNLYSMGKKCQLCDTPLRDTAVYCHRCGALWCESDGNLDTREIRILEPKDFKPSPSSQLFWSQAFYPGFVMA